MANGRDAWDHDEVTENVFPSPAHGPLGARVRFHHVEVESRDEVRASTTLTSGNAEVGADANALIVLRRLSFERTGGGRKKWQAHQPLHSWAASTHAGQGDRELLQRVLDRRQAMLDRWAAPRPVPSAISRRFPNAPTLRRGHVLRLTLATEWRLATGLGLQYGVLDSGLSLHGTYGWPSIPATTLKGLAAAGARASDADGDQVRRLLGDPRPSEPPAREGPRGRGGVVFLDALPDSRAGVKVHSDVITPHQRPYYTDTMAGTDLGPGQDPHPPGEHHAPVPVPFLSISGKLCVDLLGTDPDDLDTVAAWLRHAGDHAGGGGRTTAGYGYFTCDKAKPPRKPDSSRTDKKKGTQR